MKAAKYPAIDAGTPARAAARRRSTSASRPSRTTRTSPSRRSSAWSEPENQIATAEAGGLPPVREDLYDSKEIEKVYPGFSQIIRESIADAAARPSESPAYQDISLAIQGAVHPTTEIDPEDPSADLRPAARAARAGDQPRGAAVTGAADPAASEAREPGAGAEGLGPHASRSASWPGCCARRR